MRSTANRVADEDATYLAIGLRPAPYPPGYAPDAARFSGDRLVRVVLTGKDPDGGMPPAEPAPVPASRPTATRSRQLRWIQADELPVAAPMAVAETVSDDPGWLSIHGPRLHGDYGPAGPGGRGRGDLGGGGRRRGRQVPVGAVLVSRRAERSSERRGWNIWRVMPGGPVAVLEASVDDAASGAERVEIATRIERDLRAAFAEAADRLELADSPHAGRLRAAVGSWTSAETAPPAAGGRRKNRRRRRGGR